MTLVANARGAASRLVAGRGWPAAWGLAALIVLGLRLTLGAVMGGAWLVLRPYLPLAAGTDSALTGRVYGWLAEAWLGGWPRWRRPEWLIYMAANLLVFFSKRSVQAASLQSLARYVLALFPGFIVLSDWLSRRGARLRFVTMVVSSVGLLILSVSYSVWLFVG